MKAAFVISAVISFLLTVPLWLFLLYLILSKIEATDLMWFIYIIYVPLAILAAVVAKIAEAMKGE